MSEVRTRFAPSPTGFMHVGNLRTALYAWLLARSMGGKFILRIEDTDQARKVEGAIEIIYATLKAAGLTHDEGPDRDGGCGPYIQSQRRCLYLPYAEKLIESGNAYYCFCDKAEEENGDNVSVVDGCPGHCRNLDPAASKAKADAGAPFVIRQKLPRSGNSTYVDTVFGEITIENKVLDDQILIKRDGMPTYNFANVIDDHLMGITHVVRGSEYLPSTPKYNLLYQAFGWEIPQYIHLPLIMGRDSEGNVAKLSKRHGSVSFENLVSEGFLPEAIVNYIALLGWSPKSDREIFTLDELSQFFNVSGLNKSPAIFDYVKLRWMNSEYLKALDPAKFAEMARLFCRNIADYLGDKWPLAAGLIQTRIETFPEGAEKLAFLLKLPEYELELFNHKKSKSAVENTKAGLLSLRARLESLGEWNVEALNEAFSADAQAREVKSGQVMWQVRIAVSGLAVTPGGPAEIMTILGRKESMRRINLALERL